jgi:glycerol kinase
MAATQPDNANAEVGTRKYIGAIDQGTTSSRFIVFNEKMEIVVQHQLEHRQITPNPGWLEHDPQEIFDNVCVCIVESIKKLRQLDPSFISLAGVGITNQRETTVAWDRATKNVLCNAVVWSDLRTAAIVDRTIRQHNGDARFAVPSCGLPVSTYFSAMKMKWMLENVPDVRHAADRGTLCFGTIDAWLIWKLTGERVFATDVSNASRTMLMNLHTLTWDADLCSEFGIPMSSLPQIKSSSENFGTIRTQEDLLATELGSQHSVPICGCIGDQQGALVGNMCFEAGQAKNTYGTGCFLLANVGSSVPPPSKSGLLTTVGYRLGPDAPCIYALEGSIAGAGSCVQWMRDRLELFQKYTEFDALARSVRDSGGVTFVPAFSGLLAPHWEPEARGTILGMTLQTSKAHIVRAALEAIAMQVADVVRAVESDSSIAFTMLKVDGGLVRSRLLMELQCNYLGISVQVPSMLETTALGAAICAGLAAGVWASTDTLLKHRDAHASCTTIEPMMSKKEREAKKREWDRAVKRSKGWAKL